MEKMSGNEDWSPEDIQDELSKAEPELLKYFNLLPKALWVRHFLTLPKLAEQRINHILGIVYAREKAIVECDIREPALKEQVESSSQGIEGFGNTLRELLVSEGHVLGSGTTARVKELSLDGSSESIAVKYLLTPTTQTLSAQAEYDMLREVEVITDIEGAEKRLGVGEYIGVPHPYFFYKRGKLQCYGMSRVGGVTLEKLLASDDQYAPERDAVLATLKTRFASEQARSSLKQEIDQFMRAVHEVCLHGDIKLKNIMIDEKGILYLIDFGQSVSLRHMSDETRERFENIQDNERGQMQECVNALLRFAKDQETGKSEPISKAA